MWCRKAGIQVSCYCKAPQAGGIVCWGVNVEVGSQTQRGPKPGKVKRVVEASRRVLVALSAGVSTGKDAKRAEKHAQSSPRTTLDDLWRRKEVCVRNAHDSRDGMLGKRCIHMSLCDAATGSGSRSSILCMLSRFKTGRRPGL